jgi:ankyrin repeat protein
MRARFVLEEISFERGKDPKGAMGIGRMAQIKQEYENDWYKEFSPEEALMWASMRGKPEYVNYLLIYGVDPNYDGGVALSNGMDHPEVVRLLLDAGMNEDSLTAGLETAIKKSLEVTKMVVDAGASLNDPNLLWQSIWSDDNIEVIKYLFSNGAKIKDHSNIQSTLGYQDNMSELLKLFLSHGLKLKKTDYGILKSSASRGDSEAIKILIDYGFKVKGEPGGLALIDAARGGDIETAKLLINAGADLNATETETSYWVEHFSALTRAAENGRTEMVKLLLDSGADIKILNDKAHRIARKNGQTETLELIKHYKKMARMKAKQNKKA